MTREFDAYDCAKFKVDIEMSLPYLRIKRNRELVKEIKEWFECLPDGAYEFKGKWWKKYHVSKWGNSVDIWRTDTLADLSTESHSRIKWIIDNGYEVRKGVKYLG